MIQLDLIAFGAIEAMISAFEQGGADAILRDVAEGSRDKWIRLAGERLHTTQADYIRSIQPAHVDGSVAYVALVGQFANMIEQGMGPYDMRDTLLGPRVPEVPRGQRGKHRGVEGGFYRSIPFRHGTPSSSGRQGAAMGSGLDHYEPGMASRVGRKIYRAAKNLGPGDRLPAGILEASGGPPESVEPDIYAGMVRQGSTYTTWRTISTGVSEGWLHPGIEPRSLGQEVVRHSGTLVEMATEAFMMGLGGG